MTTFSFDLIFLARLDENEILKIANDDHLMFMLTTISESIKNDYCRTAIELKNEEKARKNYG